MEEDLQDINSLPVYDKDSLTSAFSFLEEHPFLPWKYIKEGCSSRAHYACQILKSKMQLETAKAWAFSERKLGVGDNLLHPKILPPNHGWHLHVAPAIRTRGEDDAIIWAVIDPTVATGCLPYNTWHAMLSGANSRRGLLPRRIYEPGSYTLRDDGLEFYDIKFDDDLFTSIANIKSIWNNM